MKPLTQKELADRLRVTERTIYNWRKTGKVTAIKIGGSIRITGLRPAGATSTSST